MTGDAEVLLLRVELWGDNTMTLAARQYHNNRTIKSFLLQVKTILFQLVAYRITSDQESCVAELSICITPLR